MADEHGGQGGAGPTTDQVGAWMRKVEQRLDSIHDDIGALRARQEQLAEDLYGPDDRRRAEHRQGLFGHAADLERRVRRLDSSDQDAQAVRRAARWMIGTLLTALGVLIAALSLIVRMAGGV